MDWALATTFLICWTSLEHQTWFTSDCRLYLTTIELEPSETIKVRVSYTFSVHSIFVQKYLPDLQAHIIGQVRIVDTEVDST